MPTSVKPIGTRSSQLLGRDAASTPIGTPMRTAMNKETKPSAHETPMREPMTSRTVQPGYLSEGPRSPCARLTT